MSKNQMFLAKSHLCVLKSPAFHETIYGILNLQTRQVWFMETGEVDTYYSFYLLMSYSIVKLEFKNSLEKVNQILHHNYDFNFDNWFYNADCNLLTSVEMQWRGGGVQVNQFDMGSLTTATALTSVNAKKRGEFKLSCYWDNETALLIGESGKKYFAVEVDLTSANIHTVKLAANMEKVTKMANWMFKRGGDLIFITADSVHCAVYRKGIISLADQQPFHGLHFFMSFKSRIKNFTNFQLIMPFHQYLLCVEENNRMHMFDLDKLHWRQVVHMDIPVIPQAFTILPLVHHLDSGDYICAISSDFLRIQLVNIETVDFSKNSQKAMMNIYQRKALTDVTIVFQ